MGGTKNLHVKVIRGNLSERNIAERLTAKGHEIDVRVDKCRKRKREGRMYRSHWGSQMIKSAGYDAQQQRLEIEFVSDGHICQFENVPEDIWYQFRNHHFPEIFFRNSIMGYYPERRIQEQE